MIVIPRGLNSPVVVSVSTLPVADDPASDVMARLAQRVRDARAARGLPRRVLSERSGVSPRYLAQLEAGTGNISIVLLHRVAQALDLRIEALLADETPFDPDMQRIALLYQQAPPPLQQQARALLSPQNPEVMRAGRACLIGLRGAGKSTLGALAGEELGIPFVELNRHIEDNADMPLTEVMALYGPDRYREMEAEALETVIRQHPRMILAVAGGIVAEPQTYTRLLESFHTIWIRTTPAEHMQRVRAQGDIRPMQGNPAAMTQLKALLKERTPLYEKAEAQVNTSTRAVRSSLNDVLAIIAKRRFLDLPGP